MIRKNNKKQTISHENCVKKSNELSIAKLNKGLTLNQMQLMAFAIYCTQKDGKTEFIKANFEKKFNLGEYRREEAKEDSRKLFELEFSLDNIENDEFDFLRIFQRINYKDGLFSFKWTDDMIPHILELKEKYITTDLTITSKFRSGFSWVLYDYLKAHYGYWHKPLSKDALLKLFGVEDRKTYQRNTSDFKNMVLSVAIKEINKFTEMEVWYTEQKRGRAIVGFDLHWSTGKNVNGATKKQIQQLKSFVDLVSEKMFEYININDENKRNQAIQLVRKINMMKIHTKEPICITKSHADTLIKTANYTLIQLDHLCENGKENSEKRDTSFYFNWLEEK